MAAFNRHRLYYTWWVYKQMMNFIRTRRINSDPRCQRYFKWRAAGASSMVAWSLASDPVFVHADIPDSIKVQIARQRRLRAMRVARACDVWTVAEDDPEGPLVRR